MSSGQSGWQRDEGEPDGFPSLDKLSGLGATAVVDQHRYLQAARCTLGA